MNTFQDLIVSVNGMGDYAVWTLVLLFSVSGYVVGRYIILRVISKLFLKTENKLDDILIDERVFDRLSYVVPLLIIYNFVHLFPGNIILSRSILALIVIAVIGCVNSLFSAVNKIFVKSELSKKINVKSYLQIARLLVNLLGSIVVIAVLSGKSPMYLLSGIGALTAVLMLVFRDTILSFVSSIQITSNDLFRVGDWVEAPQFGADGEVIDIALHTVKIQNWDKTISIIPTNRLIDSSFKNWRGMSDSGGRRIKRSINIDIGSIKICSSDMVNKYKKFDLLRDYIDNKLSEISEYNSSLEADSDSTLNQRALTNIGTFRAYISEYLKRHKNIHTGMTFLVRQLEPNEHGVPIQIYVFTNETDWIEYEAIQSDIFDHLLAVSREFDLRVFQNPSGKDFQKLIKE